MLSVKIVGEVWNPMPWKLIQEGITLPVALTRGSPLCLSCVHAPCWRRGLCGTMPHRVVSVAVCLKRRLRDSMATHKSKSSCDARPSFFLSAQNKQTFLCDGFADESNVKMLNKETDNQIYLTFISGEVIPRCGVTFDNMFVGFSFLGDIQ